MKIGIDISQIVYEGTGVAHYTRQLVQTLLRVDHNNKYVLFGASLRKKADFHAFIRSLADTELESKFINVPLTALDLLWNKWHFPSIEHFTGKIDAYHSSDWIEPPACCPKVTTIHDLIVYRYPEHMPPQIVETQKRKLGWVKKESRAIIADSESTKMDIIHYLGIAEEKIQVIHLGVDSQFAPQSKERVNEVKKIYGLGEEYVLCVGTQEPRKNVQRVIDAFAKLHKKNLQLAIVGNRGWGKEVTLHSQMKLLGFVPQEDLIALYSGAVSFVYPSYYEGFGLPILEAMASGTVVVTSDRGSLKEVVADKGITVDPESVTSISEAIEYTTSLSTNKRKSMIEKGQQHAARFTWQKTAILTLNLYNSL